MCIAVNLSDKDYINIMLLLKAVTLQQRINDVLAQFVILLLYIITLFKKLYRKYQQCDIYIF